MNLLRRSKWQQLYDFQNLGKPTIILNLCLVVHIIRYLTKREVSLKAIVEREKAGVENNFSGLYQN